jgi:hypothetical protein
MSILKSYVNISYYDDDVRLCERSLLHYIAHSTYDEKERKKTREINQNLSKGLNQFEEFNSIVSFISELLLRRRKRKKEN